MHRAAVLLALALVLPGAGTAAEPAGAPAAVRIVAIGDFGVGGDDQRAFGASVRRFAGRNGVHALVTLGDNDYTESPPAFATNWRESFGWARRSGVLVAGTLGNHDVRVAEGRYQFRALGMPRRYYRRAVRNVELFLLDSNLIDSAQTAWLSRALARSRARWKIAVFHHPAYSCGSYRSHPEVVREWVPLFERHRVRLALSGHDHNYQRFAARHGVSYVVHGGGGRGLYPVQQCPAEYPRRLRARLEHGFVYVVVRGDRLDGWAVRANGRRVDHFTLRG